MEVFLFQFSLSFAIISYMFSTQFKISFETVVYDVMWYDMDIHETNSAISI